MSPVWQTLDSLGWDSAYCSDWQSLPVHMKKKMIRSNYLTIKASGGHKAESKT